MNTLSQHMPAWRRVKRFIARHFNGCKSGSIRPAIGCEAGQTVLCDAFVIGRVKQQQVTGQWRRADLLDIRQKELAVLQLAQLFHIAAGQLQRARIAINKERFFRPA